MLPQATAVGGYCRAIVSYSSGLYLGTGCNLRKEGRVFIYLWGRAQWESELIGGPGRGTEAPRPMASSP